MEFLGATALAPPTGEVIKIDHLFTMQCSAGKPWLLAFMWMLPVLPILTPLQTKYISLQRYSTRMQTNVEEGLEEHD